MFLLLTPPRGPVGEPTAFFAIPLKGQTLGFGMSAPRSNFLLSVAGAPSSRLPQTCENHGGLDTLFFYVSLTADLRAPRAMLSPRSILPATCVI